MVQNIDTMRMFKDTACAGAYAGAGSVVRRISRLRSTGRRADNGTTVYVVTTDTGTYTVTATDTSPDASSRERFPEPERRAMGDLALRAFQGAYRLRALRNGVSCQLSSVGRATDS